MFVQDGTDFKILQCCDSMPLHKVKNLKTRKHAHENVSNFYLKYDVISPLCNSNTKVPFCVKQLYCLCEVARITYMQRKEVEKPSRNFKVLINEIKRRKKRYKQMHINSYYACLVAINGHLADF